MDADARMSAGGRGPGWYLMRGFGNAFEVPTSRKRRAASAQSVAGSRRTTIDLEVGVLLRWAVLSSGTSTLVSGK